MKTLLRLFLLLVAGGCIFLLLHRDVMHEGIEEIQEYLPEPVNEALHLTEEEPVFLNGGFYYGFLSEEAQYVYGKLYQACKDYSDTITFSNPVNNDSVHAAFVALIRDYPQYEWIENTYTYFVNNDNLVTSLKFELTGSEEAQLSTLESIAEGIVKDMPRDDAYASYKYIYDYIIDTTEYDVYMETDNQHIGSVLLNHRSVCAGYSKTFQFLCEKAGLYCVYVTGMIPTEDGSFEHHAWNLIRIGDQYYWVDSTWGDPVFEGGYTGITNYNYFCVPDELINREHSVSTNIGDAFTVTYPVCDDYTYEFFIRNGLYFETYDRNTFGEFLKGRIYGGTAITEVRFSTSDQLRTAVADLTVNEGLSQIVQETGYAFSSYRYMVHEALGVLYLELQY